MHLLLLPGQEFNNLMERTKLCCFTPQPWQWDSTPSSSHPPLFVFSAFKSFPSTCQDFDFSDKIPLLHFLLQCSSHSVVSTPFIRVLHPFLCVVWGRSMLFIGYFPSTRTFTDILDKQHMRLFKDWIKPVAKNNTITESHMWQITQVESSSAFHYRNLVHWFFGYLVDWSQSSYWFLDSLEVIFCSLQNLNIRLPAFHVFTSKMLLNRNIPSVISLNKATPATIYYLKRLGIQKASKNN